MLKGYKYRIYPTQAQTTSFSQHFGACRFIYNWGLANKIQTYEKDGQNISCFSLMEQLLALKLENPWLKEINAQALQQSLRHLDNAYTKFFREGSGFPKFKSKHSTKQTFVSKQSNSVNWTTQILSISKIKNIKIKLHRKFEGKIKTVTIGRNAAGRYFASILVDTPDTIPDKLPLEQDKAIGIDVGLSHFLTTSDGLKIDNPRFFRKSEKRLAYVDYVFSKMKKGSSNRAKQRIRLARIHEHVTNQRRDFLHKVTSKLVGDNQATTFCIENLSVQNMQKNHKLAKSIMDVGWGMFFELLKYKCDWSGKNLLDIGRFEPSSKLCSSCGTINKELKLSDREWKCECGINHDRDINAAINIKKLAFHPQNLIRCIGTGRAESTPVETVSIDTSLKQEVLI